MRHRTKFREDWSNRSGDMANFRFFKMAAAAILDFGNFKFLTVGTLKRVELDFKKLEISTSGLIQRPNMRHRTKPTFSLTLNWRHKRLCIPTLWRYTNVVLLLLLL